jgi:hypothetical protein
VNRQVKLSLGAYTFGAAVLMYGPTMASAASSETSPPALVSLAVHNAEASGWVHETSLLTGSGHKVSSSNDVGTTEGRQVIDSNGAHATVLVVGGNAYISADVRAIATYFDISTTDPQKYANRWLEVTSSSPGFSTVSDAVTLTSDFGHVALTGNLIEGRTQVVDGHKVVPISGHIAATPQTPAANGTLYVTTTGTVLPVEFRLAGKGLKSTTSWSKWGHPVQIAAPRSATLLSS